MRSVFLRYAKVLTAGLLLTATTPAISHAGLLSKCFAKALTAKTDNSEIQLNADIFTSHDPESIALRTGIEAGIRNHGNFETQKAAWTEYFDYLGRGASSFDPAMNYIKDFQALSLEEQGEIRALVPAARNKSREADALAEEAEPPEVEGDIVDEKEARWKSIKVKGKRLLDHFYNSVVRGDLIFAKEIARGRTPEEAYARYLAVVNQDFHVKYDARDVFKTLKEVQKNAARTFTGSWTDDLMVGGSFINGKADLNDSDLDMMGPEAVSSINNQQAGLNSFFDRYFQKKLGPLDELADEKAPHQQFLKLEYHQEIDPNFMRALNPFSFRVSGSKIFMSVAEPAAPINFSLERRLNVVLSNYQEYELPLQAENLNLHKMTDYEKEKSDPILSDGAKIPGHELITTSILKNRRNKSARDYYVSVFAKEDPLKQAIVNRFLDAPDISDWNAKYMLNRIAATDPEEIKGNIIGLNQFSQGTSIEKWMHQALQKFALANTHSDTELTHFALVCLTSSKPENRELGRLFVNNADPRVVHSQGIHALKEIFDLQKTIPEPRNLSTATEAWLKSPKVSPDSKVQFLLSMLGPENRFYEDYFSLIPPDLLPIITQKMDQRVNLRVYEKFTTNRDRKRANNLLGFLHLNGRIDNFEYKGALDPNSKPIQVQIEPVTQLQWALVMQKNKIGGTFEEYSTQRSAYFGKHHVVLNPELPVKNYNTKDQKLFVKKLSDADPDYEYHWASPDELQTLVASKVLAKPTDRNELYLIRTPKKQSWFSKIKS
jgi:hypothetical protein